MHPPPEYFFDSWAALCAPPPRETVSEWADADRVLSPESCPEPGKYRTSRTPYNKEVMDAIHNKKSSTIVAMFASQMGKTEDCNNIIGYGIARDPMLALMVQPTIEYAEAWSKEKFGPMVRDTPSLQNKVVEGKSRISGNTILHKSYPGGNLAIIGANAPAGLAGRSRRLVIFDEIDRYPDSAGTEGDPIALGEKRTENFPNAIIVKTSTPTLKGFSKIEKEFELTDKRRWFCPCPRCSHSQTLKWSQVQWPPDKPEEAIYVCEGCQAHLSDQERYQMVMEGEWIATDPSKRPIGFHINGINTVFSCKRDYVNRLHQMAAEFLKAKHGGRETLMVWVNTFLAETFEDEAERLDPTGLYKRCEQYKAVVPDEVLLLTCGGDVQPDRVELEVVGWGEGEECWGIELRQFMGNTQRPEVWVEVEDYLHSRFELPDGTKLSIAMTLIDSAHNTKAVYGFTRRARGMRVYPCRGATAENSPLISRAHGTHMLRMVGTDEAKRIIYSRLKIEEPGPRYMHFPIRDGYDEEFFAQLTAEKAETKYRNGHPHRVWVKTRPRNEALDMRVYSLAALEILNPNWKVLAKRRLAIRETNATNTRLDPLLEKPVEYELRPTPPPVQEPQRPRRMVRPPRRSNWVSSWH